MAAQLADRWVVQLSSKQPGIVDDGFTWDETLILQEHQRMRDRFGAKLVWSGDWSSFEDKNVWVTIAPTTFPDADGVLQWCYENGYGANYCAANGQRDTCARRNFRPPVMDRGRKFRLARRASLARLSPWWSRRWHWCSTGRER